MDSVVSLTSGGLDSTVLLYQLRDKCIDIHALAVNYGQRHKKEIEFAKALCESLSIPFEVADLTGITKLISNSSQTGDGDVPEGHYAEDSMKATVVPNRNMIMLAVAAGWAINLKVDAVAYAAHSGDHTIYPDCRPEFAEALNTAILLADWHDVELYRPFVQKSKADLVKLGSDLGVPFERTWSCYKGLDKHCGKCGTCVERVEAFQLAGVVDPTEYE